MDLGLGRANASAFRNFSFQKDARYFDQNQNASRAQDFQ